MRYLIGAEVAAFLMGLILLGINYGVILLELITNGNIDIFLLHYDKGEFVALYIFFILSHALVISLIIIMIINKRKRKVSFISPAATKAIDEYNKNIAALSKRSINLKPKQ